MGGDSGKALSDVLILDPERKRTKKVSNDTGFTFSCSGPSAQLGTSGVVSLVSSGNRSLVMVSYDGKTRKLLKIASFKLE